MATIVLRSVKGSPLSISEGDSNFSNLNNEKIERNGSIDFTAPQAFILGSVGAPSIKPVGSSTTGLYFPSTSSVAISIEGTQKLLVDASGITADGANLTNLNASNLTTGTVPSARLSGAYTGINQIATTLEQPELRVTGASGIGRGFVITTNGVGRWMLRGIEAAETGSNSGTNFGLYRFDDAGAFLGIPILVSRQTGAITIDAPSSGSHTFNGNITFGGVLTGNGSGLTNLNASNLATGTVPSARLNTAYTDIRGPALGNNAGDSSLVLDAGALEGTNATRMQLVNTRITAGSSHTGTEIRWRRIVDNTILGFIGFSTISSRAVVLGYQGADFLLLNSDGALTVNAPAAGSHTINGNITFGGTLTGNGSGLTSLNASNLASGTVPAARLGSGTASSAVFLRGDSTWTNTLAGRAVTAPNSVTFSATPTFDSSQSNVFYFGTLTGNVTSMTISNATDGQTIQIRFVQDATGGRTVALPSGAVVSGSINTAPNAVSWLVMTYVSSAARWEGTWTRVS